MKLILYYTKLGAKTIERLDAVILFTSEFTSMNAINSNNLFNTHLLIFGNSSNIDINVGIGDSLFSFKNF